MVGLPHSRGSLRGCCWEGERHNFVKLCIFFFTIKGIYNKFLPLRLQILYNYKSVFLKLDYKRKTTSNILQKKKGGGGGGGGRSGKTSGSIKITYCIKKLYLPVQKRGKKGLG